MRAILIVRPETGDSVPLRADVALIDLTGPDAEMSRLRAIAENYRSAGTEIWARIPAVEHPQSRLVLAPALALRPSTVFLTAAATAHDVVLLDARLAVAEALAGLAHGGTRIAACVGGTSASVFALAGFAGCSRRLAALAFDPEALKSDLAAIDADAPLALARDLALLAARSASVPAIDAAAMGSDPAGDALRSFRQGFAAKVATHPSQVDPIQAAGA